MCCFSRLTARTPLVPGLLAGTALALTLLACAERKETTAGTASGHTSTRADTVSAATTAPAAADSAAGQTTQATKSGNLQRILAFQDFEGPESRGWTYNGTVVASPTGGGNRVTHVRAGLMKSASYSHRITPEEAALNIDTLQMSGEFYSTNHIGDRATLVLLWVRAAPLAPGAKGNGQAPQDTVGEITVPLYREGGIRLKEWSRLTRTCPLHANLKAGDELRYFIQRGSEAEDGDLFYGDNMGIAY